MTTNAPSLAVGVPLASFLETYRFTVPSYQRDYKWSPDEVESFLTDVLFQSPTSRSSQFLGVILAHFAEGTATLFDGQQRVTTCFIVLYAIQDWFRTSEKGLELQENPTPKTQARIANVLELCDRLTQAEGQAKAECLQKGKICEIRAAVIRAGTAGVTLNKHETVGLNYRRVLKVLDADAKSPDFFGSLADLVSAFAGLMLYLIPAASEDEGIHLFQTFNTGKPLTSADVLKGKLQKLDGWEDIEGVAVDDREKFLKAINGAFTGTQPKPLFHAGFTKVLESSTHWHRRLGEAAKIWVADIQADSVNDQFWAVGGRDSGALGFYLALALRADEQFAHMGEQNRETEKARVLLAFKHMWLHVQLLEFAGVPCVEGNFNAARDLPPICLRMLSGADNAIGVTEALALAKEKTLGRFGDGASQARLAEELARAQFGASVGGRRLAKWLHWHYCIAIDDEHLAEGYVWPTDWEYEHIHPKAKKAERLSTSDETHEQLVHQLGNFCLLRPLANKRAGAKRPSDKAKAMAKCMIPDTQSLSKQVEQWGEATILARSAELAGKWSQFLCP